MKKEPMKIDEIIFLRPQMLCQMIRRGASPVQQKKFIEMLERNHFTNIYQIYGFDEIEEGSKDFGDLYLILKSGRTIDSTFYWNPIVFAYAFDHFEVLKYFESRHRAYDLQRCMKVPDFISNGEVTTPTFRNFLRLLIENHCQSISILLNSHYQLISFEDFIYIFTLIGGL